MLKFCALLSDESLTLTLDCRHAMYMVWSIIHMEMIRISKAASLCPNWGCSSRSSPTDVVVTYIHTSTCQTVFSSISSGTHWLTRASERTEAQWEGTRNDGAEIDWCIFWPANLIPQFVVSVLCLWQIAYHPCQGQRTHNSRHDHWEE